MGTRILPSLILVAILVQCGESDPDPDPSEALIDACHENCLKVPCSGVIEPEGDIDATCRAGCSAQVEDAMADGVACEDAYSQFQECLNATSCDEFHAWLANEPDSECRDQETSVVSNCPNVEVRDPALGPG